jgi:hypothetical protein
MSVERKKAAGDSGGHEQSGNDKATRALVHHAQNSTRVQRRRLELDMGLHQHPVFR